jgi:hypothetical protein
MNGIIKTQAGRKGEDNQTEQFNNLNIKIFGKQNKSAHSHAICILSGIFSTEKDTHKSNKKKHAVDNFPPTAHAKAHPPITHV